LLEPDSGPNLHLRLENLLSATTLLRTRRDKPYDLRPLIEELCLTPTSVAGEGQTMQIFMRLAARDGATGRPEELLDALGIPLETTRIERTRLILKPGIAMIG
jgi:hypothetical protein